MQLLRNGGLFPTSLSAYQSLENYFHGPKAHAVSYSDDRLNMLDSEYQYDGNGNLTYMDEWQYAYYTTRDYNPVTFKRRLFQIKDISIAYNAENMPISISNWGNLTTFTYDASGARSAKHVGDSTTGVNSVYYISDAYEVNVDSYGNTVVDKYIFAGNQRVAKVVTYWGYNGVELIPRGSNVNYIHKDHLGSTTVVTDDLGNVPYYEPELIQYEPYGLARTGTSLSTVTDYAFTDQEFDNSTGFYNYDARLYNPEIGMFITADSIIPSVYDPQSLNRYAYARNNPIKYLDPNGREYVISGSAIHVLTTFMDINTKLPKTNLEVTVTDKGFKATLSLPPLKKGEKQSSYERSMRTIIESTDHTVTVVESTGKNITSIINKGGASTPGVGSDVIIKYNRNDIVQEAVKIDKTDPTSGITTTEIVGRTPKPSDMIEHETEHAKRAVEGNTNRNKNQEEIETINAVNAAGAEEKPPRPPRVPDSEVPVQYKK